MRRLVLTILAFVAAASIVSAQHHIPELPANAPPAVKLPSGLAYIDLLVGTGVRAQRGRMVRIVYTAWVTKNQLMFDFRDEKDPLAFRLGSSGQIKGLEDGVVGMRVGGKRRLLIPPRLGHGSRATKLIPPNSSLTYDVELVSVSRPGV
jgi:FKBP-type peptidyl-prolyl cis-trans isomerase